MTCTPFSVTPRWAFLGLLLLIAPGTSRSQDAASDLPPNPEAAAGSDAAVVMEPPPPLELDEEQQALKDAFDAEHRAMADALGEMRAVYIRYMNDVDRSRDAVSQYRDARNKARDHLDATYEAALRLIAQAPVVEAASFVATWVQYREANDIYSRDTFEGAARLIDGGVNYVFLFAAAARSAVVSGEFETAKRLFEAIEEENLEKTDRALMFQLDQLKENWEREQAFLEADAKNENLPRVQLKTTRGDVVLELFLDHAPNTVSHFVSLVDEGFYDGLDFYQVIEHLLAVTGDPNGDGSGHAGRFIADEAAGTRPPMRGSLVMAKLPAGESGKFLPDTASSQFAILFLPLADSMEQTVFGRVIEGMDVISSLRRVDPHAEKKQNQVLVPPDRVLSAKVIRRPSEMPEPRYIDSR